MTVGRGWISSSMLPEKNPASFPLTACSTLFTVKPILQLANNCGFPTNTDSSGDGLVAIFNPNPDQLAVNPLLLSSKFVSRLLTSGVVANLLLKGALQAAMQSDNGGTTPTGLNFRLPSSWRSDFNAISSFRPSRSPSILNLEKLTLNLPVVRV